MAIIRWLFVPLSQPPAVSTKHCCFASEPNFDAKGLPTMTPNRREGNRSSGSGRHGNKAARGRRAQQQGTRGEGGEGVSRATSGRWEGG